MTNAYLTPKQEAAAKAARINYDPRMDEAANREFYRYLALIEAAEDMILNIKPNKPYMVIASRHAPYTMRITYSACPETNDREASAGMFEPWIDEATAKAQAVRIADNFSYMVD